MSKFLKRLGKPTKSIDFPATTIWLWYVESFCEVQYSRGKMIGVEVPLWAMV